jgi:hypothetical protein
MVSLLDQAIVSAYTRFNTPADQILTDPALGQKFVDQVNNLLPYGQRSDLLAVNKRLL